MIDEKVEVQGEFNVQLFFETLARIMTLRYDGVAIGVKVTKPDGEDAEAVKEKISKVRKQEEIISKNRKDR